ncbi:class I glutamine amidotransferase-like protein [Rhizopus microsporus ATCC 52813]|uniref:Class I glutamine amidotransferase-like protein n=1 Tax=Rhizopus microsporus ATCC 52813 TaxID=1340429 RepID=A0A2G4SHI8_RHIZD|nr:class I glutamine amidotransferase-like protein [Rhizopus microsporus ATCC 52813]PHZ08235.1 class I glutamine amidotransferase-like protein [Rhizopus microsporus ATCC 52813]
MTRSLQLALLVCDTPMPEVKEIYGDYPVMFSTVFGLAATNLGLTLSWDFFDVVDAQEYPSVEDIKNRKYDAIIITGSKYNAHDDVPWILKLVEFVKTARGLTGYVKLIGICFGHQIIARASGGITGRNPNGWEVGYVEVQLTPLGKEIFDTDKPFLRVNQFHQDHVIKLPPGFRCLAFTEHNTPHHSMISNDRQCITVQGHPEFNKDTVKIMIEKRKELGIVPLEVADKALETLKTHGLNMEDIWLCEEFLQFVVSNQ